MFRGFFNNGPTPGEIATMQANMASAQPSVPTLDQINSARTNARQFGDGTTYALDFNVGGKDYTFIPNNVSKNGGVTAGDNTYLLPWFTDAKNQASLSQIGSSIDLSSNSGLSKYLSSQGQSTSGYLVPSGSIGFDSNVQTLPTANLGGSLSGLKDVGGSLAYGLSGGAGSRYYTTNGEVHDPRVEYSSMLGDVFGSVGNDVADFVNSDLGKAALVAGSLYAGGAFDPNSSIGADALAADNIDVGGGWNPATGLGDAATAQAAAATGVTSAAATPYYEVPTVPDVSPEAPAVPDAIKADNIDVGGGYNPATGAGDAATAAAAAETGVTSSAAIPHYAVPEVTAPAASSMSDKLLDALGIAAGTTALGSLLIPEVPGMAQSTYEAKPDKPDWSMKFDDPVHQLQLPDSFDFQLDSVASPYLTKTQTGPVMGGMLFDPTQSYNSSLVRGLRAASNAPASVNPGFTLYQSAKP